MPGAYIRARSGPAWALVSLWLLCATAAWADGEFAAHLKAGNEAFKGERYEDSQREFSAAYAIRPVAELLPNIGTSLLRLKRYRDAITYYELYLKVSKNPPSEARVRVEERMAEARRGLALEEAEAQRVLHEREHALRLEQEEHQRLELERLRLVRESEEQRRRLVEVDRVRPVPLYRRPWLWVAIGGVAAVGVTAGVLGWYYSDPLRGWQVQSLQFTTSH